MIANYEADSKHGMRLTWATSWDESGNEISESILPLSCLRDDEVSLCAWPTRELPGNSFQDPCLRCKFGKKKSSRDFCACAHGSFVQPLAKELPHVTQSIVSKLRDSGKRIAFHGSTDRVAVIITMPSETNGMDSHEYYRIRLARDSCSAGTRTCILRVAASLVHVPIVSGHHDNDKMTLLDDNLTDSIVAYVEQRLRESDAKIEERKEKIREWNTSK